MKKLNYLFLSLAALTLLSIGCNNAPKGVKIGEQVWMAKNLDVDHFRNGDPIFRAVTREEWEKAGEERKPAWCYYENKESNGEKYGKLYNWFAVNDPRGLAPEGWRVATDEDWKILEGTVDSLYSVGDPEWDEYGYRGYDVAKRLKSTSGWGIEPDDEPGGTDEFKFTALPGGYRKQYGGFEGLAGRGRGKDGYWWTKGIVEEKYACSRDIIEGSNVIARDKDEIDDYHLAYGFSVRCVKK